MEPPVAPSLPVLAPSHDLEADRLPKVRFGAAGDGGAHLQPRAVAQTLNSRRASCGAAPAVEDIAPYHLGIEPPLLHLLINRVHPVGHNARLLIQQALRDLSGPRWHPRAGHRRAGHRGVSACSYAIASASGRIPPAAGRVASPRFDNYVRPCDELFPRRRHRFAMVSGPSALLDAGSPMANAHEPARGRCCLRPDRVRG